ncbi:MAG: DUF2111 domain-containing protein [Methanobacteriaceae archaeon]|nr:DUF2111 domain-containing protein [Methanobacteriaceae archaeon]
MNITPSASGKEIAPIAMAFHELINKLPLTMRTKNSYGVRVEDGVIVDYNYTGPVLERVIKTGKTCRGVPKSGPYQGIPVVVVPVKENNELVCVIGIVDITKGIFSDLVEISRRPEPVETDTSKGEFY